MPICRHRRFRVSVSPAGWRLICAAVVGAAVVAAAVALTGAQVPVPGTNVNMVSGTGWPNGDPFLQRQNEPSIAASTRNPLHLLAGANDYRTVDLPGLPDGDETGDAWLGVFTSFDGGRQWQSTLLPGYPQDRSPAGLNSPLHGFQAGADPVVRAGTNGLLYYSGLAFDRGTDAPSAVFVARFVDNNDKENGDAISLINTSLVAVNSGRHGVFLDKPWLAVDIPRGRGTCRIPAPGPNDTTTTQVVPAGPAYMAYTEIRGEGATLQSRIMFSASYDCGASWTRPVRISDPRDRVNQGATIAIDPRTGTVYVAWRRFASGDADHDRDGDSDAIMVTRSDDDGRRFDPPGEARRFPRGKKHGLLPEWVFEHRDAGHPQQAARLSPFDEATTDTSFRTNGYPSMTIDGSGRVYLAWTERGFGAVRPDPITGDARVLVATSRDGHRWQPPVVADEPHLPGHQFMPTITFAGGKLLLVYYDQREDVSQTFSTYVDEANIIPYTRRHTIDIRAVEADPGAQPVFGPSVQVSRYLIGSQPPGAAGQPIRAVPCGPPGSNPAC
ncbi:MAG TPA: sialidase family protein, partial [Vicinamibacterales bacterium]|nr:sialidase family protein [Vicinamibacterales bacterium]